MFINKVAAYIKNIEIIDKTFLKSPRHYIVQSLMAVLALIIILNFVSLFTQTVIVAVLGASTFIVFAMPGTIAAEPRRLIGGNVVGIITGVVCFYALMNPAMMNLYAQYTLMHWIPAAVSVGLSMFLMVIFNVEHPPAAGTALGLVISPWTYQTILFILLYAILLSVVKVVFRKHLKDLYT
jgi:CBS-domain-containing membrane protein